MPEILFKWIGLDKVWWGGFYDLVLFLPLKLSDNLSTKTRVQFEVFDQRKNKKTDSFTIKLWNNLELTQIWTAGSLWLDEVSFDCSALKAIK